MRKRKWREDVENVAQVFRFVPLSGRPVVRSSGRFYFSRMNRGQRTAARLRQRFNERGWYTAVLNESYHQTLSLPPS